MKRLILILLVVTIAGTLFGQNKAKYVHNFYGGITVGGGATRYTANDPNEKIDSIRIIGGIPYIYSSGSNTTTNWNTAYTDRLKWDGGSTGLTAATGRTSLGGSTVGQNVFTLTNPSAVTFLRMNADNTVTALSAANFKTALSLVAGDVSLGNVTNESKATMFASPTFTTAVTLPATTNVPSGGVIQFNTTDVTLTHSSNVLTLAGGNLALGANSLTMTGSIAATGSRVTKGWFADVESTNLPTVNGGTLKAALSLTATDVGLANVTNESKATMFTSPTLTGTAVLPTTTSVGDVSSTELGYVNGVTSAIQTQINNKADTAGQIDLATVFSQLVPDTVQHTASYTVGASDWGTDQHCLRATPIAITIPANLSEWPVGGVMNFYGEGAGIMVFKKSGVTFISDTDSIATSRKGQVVNIKKIATNKYWLVGPLTD